MMFVLKNPITVERHNKELSVMFQKRLYQVCIFFALLCLSACMSVRPQTSTPAIALPSALPETLKSMTPSPVQIASPASSSTTEVTFTPEVSPTLVVSDLLSNHMYTLFQFTCFVGDCVYEAWVENVQGRYIPQLRYAGNDNSDSPAHALLLTFANTKDLVAYWTDSASGQLWISDLAYQEPRLIFSDEANDYRVKDPPNLDYKVKLTWSPDDLHLIVDVPSGSTPDLIYDLQTEVLEPWPWECDQIAFSPRTEHFATWCSSTSGEARYAVMEWGGEIWYSEQPPADKLVRGVKLLPPQWIETLLQTWAWSADGQQIAYFDPADFKGYLHIVDASGKHLKVLPGGVKQAGEITAPADLQWSQDGQRLLVHAYGSKSHPCPLYRSPVSPNSVASNAPCWQVLDTATGNILWTLLDSAEGLMATQSEPADAIVDWKSLMATISPDGKLVALTLTSRPIEYGYVINIDTGEIKDAPAPVNTMRWGIQPNVP